jgi:hypothetical protein
MEMGSTREESIQLRQEITIWGDEVLFCVRTLVMSEESNPEH